MDNWEENIINWLTDVQKEIDHFYQKIEEDINRTVTVINKDIDKWMEDCEEYIDDMTIEFNNLILETDTLITELINLFLDDEIINEDYSQEDYTENWEDWFTEEDYQRKPNPQKHPACVGCTHYHGHSYGSNLLVCAMHPYGWENENCPDWEGE